jgi:hypothetical protein
MMFVLLERDVTAPDVIRYWAKKRCEARKNKPSDPQIVEALKLAKLMKDQYRATSV